MGLFSLKWQQPTDIKSVIQATLFLLAVSYIGPLISSGRHIIKDIMGHGWHERNEKAPVSLLQQFYFNECSIP